MPDFIDNFEEVDTAFAEAISDCVIDGNPVKVGYYSPDVDLVSISKPSLVFYRSGINPDGSRVMNDEVKDNILLDVNSNPTQMDVRKPPEPWFVYYILRTVYEYQQDGVALNRYLLRKFPKGSFLTIKNVGYDIQLLNTNLTGSGYKDFGRTDNGKKVFGETYMYKVSILLDLYDRTTIQTPKIQLRMNLGNK